MRTKSYSKKRMLSLIAVPFATFAAANMVSIPSAQAATCISPLTGNSFVSCDLTTSQSLAITSLAVLSVTTNHAVNFGAAANGASLTNSGQVVSASSTYYAIFANAAAQNVTVDNQASATVSVSVGTAIKFDGDLDGSISNSGLIQAGTTSTTLAVGVSVGDGTNGISGMLTNSGDIQAVATSSSSAIAGGVFVDGDLSATGTLNNSGQITGQATASTNAFALALAGGVTITGDLAGTLDNSGTIKGIAVATATNSFSNVAYGIGAGLSINGDITGSLVNSGNISADIDAYASFAFGNRAYGIGAGIIVAGDVTSTGSIMNSGTINVEVDALASNASYNSATAIATGIYDDLDGTLTNTATGVIQAYGIAEAYDAGSAAEAWASGAGINSDGDLTGTIDNSGVIGGYASATANDTWNGYAEAYARGIGVNGDVTSTGTITNSGGTIGGYAFASASATNGGYGYAYARGIDVGGDFYGTITNSGTIEAEAFATGNNTVWAYATGLNIDSDFYGTLTNTTSGTISGTVSDMATDTTGNAYAYASGSAVGMELGDITYLGTITNNGTISGTSSATASVAKTGTALATTANAYVYAYSAVGIDMDDNYGVLTNNGTISGSVDATATATAVDAYAYADAEYAYGIDMNNYDIAYGGSLVNTSNDSISGTVTVNVTANGSTSADVYINDAESAYGIYDLDEIKGGSSLTNSGTIKGEIKATATATAGNTAGTAGDASATINDIKYASGIASMDDIEAGSTLTNEGTIKGAIDGDVTASGVTNAYGRIADMNSAYGIAMEDMYGTLYNSGSIMASLDATVTATATGNTAKTSGDAHAKVSQATIAYGLEMGQVGHGATLTNTSTGVISATINATASAYGVTSADAYIHDAYIAYGIELDDMYGTLTNDGTISAAINSYAYAETTGNLNTGDASATAYAYSAYGIYDMEDIGYGASLTNNGTISGSMVADAAAYGVTNAYAEVNDAEYAQGLDMEDNYGTLYNSGSITASLEATAFARATGNTAATLGDASASVANASYAFGIDMEQVGYNANLTNTSTGVISGAITATATAEGVTEADALIANASYAYGINMNGYDMYGTLDNSGMISGTINATAKATASGGDGATYDGDAWASVTGNSAYGIYDMTDIGYGSSLTNTGTIKGTMDLDAAAYGVTMAYGLVDAGEYAFGLEMDDNYGTLYNSGSITASIDATAYAIATGNTAKTVGNASAYIQGVSTAFGISMDQIGYNGSLTNTSTGTITGTMNAMASAYGVTKAFATIDTAEYAYGLLMDGYDMYGTLDNSGTISGTINGWAYAETTGNANTGDADAIGYGYYAYGIYDMDNIGYGAEFDNSGTISGAMDARATANGVTDAYAYIYYAADAGGITMNDNYGTLDNSGTISGSIDATAIATATGNTAKDAGHASAQIDNVDNAVGYSMSGETGPDGSLTNTSTGIISGTINATASAYGVVEADADINSASGAYGMDADDSYMYGTLDNSGMITGTINATAYAVTTGNLNTGEADATAYGLSAYGIIDFDDIGYGATLDNSGTITGTINATATALGVTDAYGYIHYAKAAYGITMDDQMSGRLDNSGTISGTINATATATTTGNTAKDAGHASAYISNALGAEGLSIDEISHGASLTNTSTGIISGMINATASAYGVVEADAYINSASYAYGIDMNDHDLDGTLDNSGIIKGEINSTAYADTTGNLNTGEADATAYAYSAYGFYDIDDIGYGALLDNSGTISAVINADATAIGVTDAFASVSYAEYAYAIDMYHQYGTLENSGSITASIDATATATATGNTAKTTGDAEAQVSYASSAFGLEMEGMWAGSTLTNTSTGIISGTINATAAAYGVTSADADVGSPEYAYGIDFNTNDMYGTFTNNGIIKGELTSTAYAETSGNANTGDASAYGYGLSVYAIYGMEDIGYGSLMENSGTISGSMDVNATAIGVTNAYGSISYADYAYGIAMDDINGALMNSGSITGSIDATVTATATGNTAKTSGDAEAYIEYAEYAYGIEMDAIKTGASLTNTSTGIISATINATASAYGVTAADALISSAEYAYGIQMDDNDIYGTLDNSGLISATINAAAFAETTGNLNTGDASATVYYAMSAYGIMNIDDIKPGGSLVNSGTISGMANATATANGVTNAYAYVEYASLVDGIDMGSINSGGSMSNSGTISGTINATAVATATGNTAKTSGDAEADIDTAYSAFGIDMSSIDANGSLTNTSTGIISATINATATANGVTSATADIEYASDAYGIAMSTLDGTLDNSGSISATIDAMATATASGGNNTAGTNGYAYAHLNDISDAFGIEMGDINFGGMLDNSGTLTASVTASAIANGTSSASATINKASAAYGIEMGTLNGTLDNSGSISASAAATASATATGTGATAKAVAYASADDAYGIELGDITGIFGELNNSNTISASGSATATANGVKTGTATANVTDIYGIHMDTLTGILDNSGSITASGTASAIASNSSGRVTAGRFDLASPATAAPIVGISLASVGNDGELNNSGTISASASASGEGVTSATAAAAGITLTAGLDASGNIVNSGTISAMATASVDGTSSIADAFAVGIGSTGPINGTIDNSSTISATATASVDSTSSIATSIAAGVAADTFNGTLNNSDTISGMADNGADGYALYFWNGSGEINNETGGTLWGNLLTGGTISLNNSGTVHIPAGADAMVAGDYDQDEDGTLSIGVIDDTTYGNLTVGGTATFTTGTGINVEIEQGASYLDGMTLLDVIDAGSLEDETAAKADADTFNVTSGSALYSFEVISVAGDAVDLGASYNSVNSMVVANDASTGSGAASLFDSWIINDSIPEGMDDFMFALISLDTSKEISDFVSNALPAVSGDISLATLDAIDDANHVVRDRQAGQQGANSGDEPTGRNLWARAFGSRADQDSNSGAFGYEADSAGLVVGVDGEVSSTSMLGGALAYFNSEIDGKVPQYHTGDVDTFMGIFYGTYHLNENSDIDWQLNLATHSNETKRNLGGGVVASGDYDGWSAHVGADIDRRYVMNDMTTFTPSARIDYTYLDDDGYTETGAGGANLIVGSNSIDELILGVDGEIAHNFTPSTLFTADLGVGFDVLADQGTINAAFAGAPSASFQTTGIDRSWWLVRGGLGLVFGAEDAMQFSLNYDFKVRDDFMNNSLSLKFNMPF